MNVQLQYGSLYGRYTDQATGWAVWGLIPGRSKIVSSLEMCTPALGTTQRLTELVEGLLSGGQISRGVKLITHLHRVLRLRMRGSIPLLPDVASWRAWGLYIGSLS